MNRRPHRCERCALPAELQPHFYLQNRVIITIFTKKHKFGRKTYNIWSGFQKNQKFAIITLNFMILDNLDFIRKSIEENKKPSQFVELVAVTKTFPPSAVSTAIKNGIKHIGESKIQEALPKFAELGNDLNGVWRHFIGHLQSNKAKKAVENFDLIQSLDSFDLAKDIDRHAKNINKVQNCLIEVKVSTEATKTGINAENVEDFYKQCKDLPNVSIKGLMVITPLSANPEDSRAYFRDIHSLFKKLQYDDANFGILSMGMSDDYIIAVQEGATMVRVGSALFGERDYGNK